MADGSMYTQLCFDNMGLHYMNFDHTPDQDCNEVIPFQVRIYSRILSLRSSPTVFLSSRSPTTLLASSAPSYTSTSPPACPEDCESGCCSLSKYVHFSTFFVYFSWEHPNSLAVDGIVDSGPDCLYAAVSDPGLTTMHIYFRDFHITC